MELIDTHAHVYDKKMMEYYEEWVQRARESGVSTIYLPNIDLASIEGLRDLLQRDGQLFKGMMGLHPCEVKADWQEVMGKIEQELFEHASDYVAVGEIGLDYHWDLTFKKEQIHCFEVQMDWAIQLNKPIAIHTRKSLDEGIQMVKGKVKQGLRGVFHCFSGSWEQAKQLMDTGFYMGIGGVITYKNAGLAEVVKEIPMEYLVLETDAPFLTPVPHRGKLNEPGYLTHVVQKIAEVKNMDVEEVAHITTLNAKRLFGER